MISACYAYVFPIPVVAPHPPIALVRQTLPITQRVYYALECNFGSSLVN